MAGVNTQAKEAGAALRQMREEKKLSQMDVARDSARRFGEENTITTAQLSRIEGGKFDRVTLDDAVRIGQLYGMTPNQVATLYGLWDERQGRPEPEPISEARHLATTLPDDLRDQLLQWIQFAVLTTRDQMLHRLRGEPQRPLGVTDWSADDHTVSGHRDFFIQDDASKVRPQRVVGGGALVPTEVEAPPRSFARDAASIARLKKAKPGDLSFAREAEAVADLPKSQWEEAVQNSPIGDKGALFAMALRVSEAQYRATLDAEHDIMRQSGAELSEPAVPPSPRGSRSKK